MGKSSFSLCWDCKKAIGGCSWADDFQPVKGWDATTIKPSGTKAYISYVVHSCPLFIRDAYNGGLKRVEKKKVG